MIQRNIKLAQGAPGMILNLFYIIPYSDFRRKGGKLTCRVIFLLPGKTSGFYWRDPEFTLAFSRAAVLCFSQNH